MEITMEDNPQDFTCHAQIEMAALTDGSVTIQLRHVEDDSNPAVRFAKYLCEHSQGLLALFGQQERGESPIKEPRIRLLGPDGKMVS